MKVLVTGGCGFIGSWVVDYLVEKEYEVIVVDNLSIGKKESWESEGVRFYELDINDFESLNKIFDVESPELVFHLAANAMLRVSLEDPLYDARCNILGTISVLECCRLNKVRKIIYTSTGGARVGEPKYLPVDEKHPLNPCSPYGISKHTAEHYVWMYNQLYGLDYLIFCFGNVYGPRDDPRSGRLIPFFIDLMLKNQTPKIFGDGLQTRDFIYVKDLAEFIVDSANKNPEHKLFHLANGKQISVNEVWRDLKDVFGFQGEAEHVAAIKGEVRDIVLDISLAKDELGWNPKTSIGEGIAETIRWFKGESRI